MDDLLPTFTANGRFQGPIHSWVDAADSAAQRHEVQEMVRSGIARLPVIYRTVLLLRDIEGFDTQESAEILEISQNLVKTRLHRGRQALRTILEPVMQETP